MSTNKELLFSGKIIVPTNHSSFPSVVKALKVKKNAKKSDVPLESIGEA